MRLAGKAALITGAARGTGLAFVRDDAAETARLALAGMDMARARAAETGTRRVANAVAPMTDITRKASEEKKVEVGTAIPFGWKGMPEDLTGMAIFLAIDAAGQTVGQTRDMDGGQWMN